MAYVVARTGHDRPALQHIVGEVGDNGTICGIDMRGWTRFFMATQLSVLLCKRCQRIANVDVQMPTLEYWRQVKQHKLRVVS